MYFSKITTFAIVAAFPAAFAFPIFEARQDGTTCQTSSGSPLTGDVTAVINQLKGEVGILCAQTNGEASGKSLDFPIRTNIARQTDSSRLHHSCLVRNGVNCNLWRSGR